MRSISTFTLHFSTTAWWFRIDSNCLCVRECKFSIHCQLAPHECDAIYIILYYKAPAVLLIRILLDPVMDPDLAIHNYLCMKKIGHFCTFSTK